MGSLPDWIYRQSAVLPYRQRGDVLEVLLITSRKGRHWVLPKGIIEPGLTSPGSAVKEASEEAGVEGDVSAGCMGRYLYGKWGGTCEVEVFPMMVTAELEKWPESGIRRRKWMPVKKAAKQVSVDELKRIIRRLPGTIEAIIAKDRVPFAAATRRKHLIYIFRHAKSSWDNPDLADFDRPLSLRGQRAGVLMRDYIQFADMEPDLVLCSSSVRTRQTLDAILPAIGAQAELKYDRRLYNGGAQALLNRLRRLPEEVASVMVIGHNPALQALATRLAGSGDPEALIRLDEKFPTAALATLVVQQEHWQDVAAGNCEMHSLVVPRELA